MGVVIAADTRLRKLGLNNLPLKVPPGIGLPAGAISASYARPLRQGEYMIRLDALCLHTILAPREAALQLARDAVAGNRRRVQFVMTELVRSAVAFEEHLGCSMCMHA